MQAKKAKFPEQVRLMEELMRETGASIDIIAHHSGAAKNTVRRHAQGSIQASHALMQSYRTAAEYHRLLESRKAMSDTLRESAPLTLNESSPQEVILEVRLHRGLHDALKHWAAEDHRTVPSQVEQIIREHVRSRDAERQAREEAGPARESRTDGQRRVQKVRSEQKN